MKKSKLEESLELLSNGKTKMAESKLHELIVEMSREIWQDMVNEDFDDEESLGGDETEDFISDIESDMDDVETDELNDGEFETDDDFGVESDEPVEDRVDELEAQLSELRDMFDRLMSDEMEEPYHDAEDFPEYSDEEVEEVEDKEDLEEATNFSDKVATPANREGQHVGTGKNSKTAQVNSRSPYSNAAVKDAKSKAVDFAGGDEKGVKAAQGKKEQVSDNIGEEPKKVSADSQEAEGKMVGTGKNTKTGETFKKSPLTKKPS